MWKTYFSPPFLLFSLCSLVFRLTTNSDISSINDESTTLFAVAPKEAAESVATAHERDMVQFREMVSDERYETKPSIAPADDIVERMNNQVDHKQSHASLVSTPFVQSKRPGAKKTTTTAASFFAKPQTTSKETSKKSKTTSTTATKKAKTSSKKPTPPPGKENVPALPTEKENVVRETQKMAVDPAATVGNADDFVADEEESDDEVEIVAATKKTKKKQPARAAAPSPPPSPKRAASPVRGAMDAFCSEQPSSQQQNKEADPTHNRKRRKRLVEKTFMENGYLRTETQAVWEDMPTDEEEAETAKSAPIATKKKPASNTTKGQPMKQMGLKGFFAKK
jgi:hypothetical protein